MKTKLPLQARDTPASAFRDFLVFLLCILAVILVGHAYLVS